MRYGVAAAALLAGCAAACTAGDASEVASMSVPYQPVAQPVSEVEPTRILDRDTAYKLRNNSGITLQWIGWDERGRVAVAEDEHGVWHLSGVQQGAGGTVSVRGRVTEIGSDYFLLDGRIVIENTPDPGRLCDRDKRWRFAVTQGRKYWRLREFEWCDYLTDYIDIYF